ncbi:hypothetical protein H0H93_012552 [Arthromyces matolae]|nr:hypothetical protein H0H93_012552 [Arthromyces matolae]
MIAAIRRLSQATGLYPARFFVNDPAPAPEDEPVASGSYADVFKVKHQGEDTCCKVIRVYQHSLIYAREAIVWAQLSHPNILPFYGISRYRSRMAFVTRWAANGHIGEYLKNNAEVDRVLLCLDIACGVKYLHENDIVHGDLKGVNVLVDSCGRACLGDFGLSSVMDPVIIKWTSQSTIASKGGTTRWQAPELLETEDVVETVYNTKASDVYAWAILPDILQIYTNQYPFFEVPNIATVRKMIMQGKTPSHPPKDHPAWLNHGLSNAIWSLMIHCWHAEASARPTIDTIVSKLTSERPTDPRPMGDWQKRTPMSFRNAESVDLSKGTDAFIFWEDLANNVRILYLHELFVRGRYRYKSRTTVQYQRLAQSLSSLVSLRLSTIFWGYIPHRVRTFIKALPATELQLEWCVFNEEQLVDLFQSPLVSTSSHNLAFYNVGIYGGYPPKLEVDPYLVHKRTFHFNHLDVYSFQNVLWIWKRFLTDAKVTLDTFHLRQDDGVYRPLDPSHVNAILRHIGPLIQSLCLPLHGGLNEEILPPEINLHECTALRRFFLGRLTLYKPRVMFRIALDYTKRVPPSLIEGVGFIMDIGSDDIEAEPGLLFEIPWADIIQDLPVTFPSLRWIRFAIGYPEWYEEVLPVQLGAVKRHLVTTFDLSKIKLSLETYPIGEEYMSRVTFLRIL